MFRWSIVATCSALLVTAVLASAAVAHQPRGQGLHEPAAARPAESGYAPPIPATLGGPFEMVDHTGRRVTQEVLRGKVSVLFFGFYGCRESCPTALDKLAPMLEQLGTDAARVQPLFIDVSMEKMDLKGLAQWVSNFHPSLVGLSGSRAGRFEIVRLYKVRREYKHHTYSARETGPRLDHSSYFYIVDASGQTQAILHHTLSPEEIAAAVRRWL
ncbi:MAG: SCO family protein [Hyphomicrobiaceae bacterium]